MIVLIVCSIGLIHTSLHPYVCMFVYMYVCIYVCMYVCVCVTLFLVCVVVLHCEICVSESRRGRGITTHENMSHSPRRTMGTASRLV